MCLGLTAVIRLVVFVEVDGLQKLQPLRRLGGGGLFRWAVRRRRGRGEGRLEIDS